MMGFAWLLVKLNYIQIIQQCLHRIPLKSKKREKQWFPSDRRAAHRRKKIMRNDKRRL